MKKLYFLFALLLASIFSAQSLWAVKCVYTSFKSNTRTLTYYYDDKFETDERPNSEKYNPDNERWIEYHDRVEKVVIDASMREWYPSSLLRMFYGKGEHALSNVTSITGLSNLNTANVTNMGYMFYDCSSLTELDLSDFNTVSLEYAADMFNGCSSLKSLDLSSFNTSKVTDMQYMFFGCTELTSLNLSSFNTANVEEMKYMFCDCFNLISVDMMKFRFDALRSAFFMFKNCKKLKTIYCGADLSARTELVSSDGMLENCPELTGGNGTSSGDVSKYDKTYARPDGGPSTPGLFTKKKVLYADLSADGQTMYIYYDNNPKTAYLDWNADGMGSRNMKSVVSNAIKEVVIKQSVQDARPTTCRQWFYQFSKLHSISGINYLNTSEVTSMRKMFQSCNELERLDITGFDTKNVTDMCEMFFGCFDLKELNFSNFNTSKVTTMDAMFRYCYALTSLDFSNFNTPNLETTGYMFSECKALRSVDISNFNTAKLTDMSGMFNQCDALVSVRLPSDLDQVNTTRLMFYNCAALQTIYCNKDLSASPQLKFHEQMFLGCSSLKGGKGTAYAYENPFNKTYARPDGGPSAPGYFTSNAKVYTVRQGNELHYRYDEHFNASDANMEEYDPINHPSATRWTTYYNQITKVVIEASMKDAPLTSMREMFFGGTTNTLSNVTTIMGLEYLNTSNVTDMAYMFYECSKLTELDLSKFDVSNLQKANFMFKNCFKLKTIYCNSDWNEDSQLTTTNSIQMFSSCTQLKGANGTPYSASYVNKKYARPDGGPDSETPGYFTPTDDGIEEIFANPSSGRKVLYNGQVLIERGGKVYTIMGQKVM